MAGPLRWMRARMGVRVASALAASAAVAVALVLAGAALVLLVDSSLRTTLENTAAQQAEQVGDRVSGNFAGDIRKNAIDATAVRTDLVQVVIDWDREGSGDVQVLGASRPLAEQDQLVDLMPRTGETESVPGTWIELSDGTVKEVLVVAHGTSSLGRPIVVYAAQPLDGVHAATDTVLFLVLLGVPLLVLVAGGFTYLFAGRALRPVEAIRSQVADLTEKDLGRRVPVPGSRDEVGRLAETMNGMLARLQDAQGVQRRFVADASHELRSPLATIATGLELLAAGDGRVDAGTVAALRGETERLSRLVDALLLLARADERGLQPRRDEVDLDEVAQAEQGRPSDGRVLARVRAEPVRVRGDRGQLGRVVRNLVDNATRHARSRVLVTVRRESASAVLEVGDDGPGVPLAQRSRVFERFVRLDDARARADGGAGLGLAIVAEVVAAHGGTVELTDSPMGGALFRVRLPIAEDGSAAPPGPGGPGGAAAEPGGPPAPGGHEPWRHGPGRGAAPAPAPAVPPVAPRPSPRPAVPAGASWDGAGRDGAGTGDVAQVAPPTGARAGRPPRVAGPHPVRAARPPGESPPGRQPGSAIR